MWDFEFGEGNYKSLALTLKACFSTTPTWQVWAYLQSTKVLFVQYESIFFQNLFRGLGLEGYVYLGERKKWLGKGLPLCTYVFCVYI